MSYTLDRTGEVELAEDEFIVSKTDLKGKILYANRAFMRISGYAEPELLGKPHSIIRHPDMPRGVFRLLWQTIREGQECFAYVKNRTKEGGYYWVFANVTADRDQENRISGFFSVRRKVRREVIPYIEELYARMRHAEQKVPESRAPDVGIQVLMEEIRKRGFQNYETFILGV